MEPRLPLLVSLISGLKSVGGSNGKPVSRYQIWDSRSGKKPRIYRYCRAGIGAGYRCELGNLQRGQCGLVDAIAVQKSGWLTANLNCESPKGNSRSSILPQSLGNDARPQSIAGGTGRLYRRRV